MVSGILAGIFWAIETMLLSFALSLVSLDNSQFVFLISFVTTFLHDSFSAIWILIYNLIKGNIKKVVKTLKSKEGKYVILASIIGGPVGMSGYVLCVNYLGAAIGAVASAIYPAIGAILAYFFLKDRLSWYRWLFLLLTLLGVYGLSYTAEITISNYLLGICGVLMCSFGWGFEAVILAKSLKTNEVKEEYALLIRQTTSALTYATVLLPLLKGWGIVKQLFECDGLAILLVALAGLSAMISYLFYYKAISLIGPSKAMALNVSYGGWATIFSLVIQFIKEGKVAIEPLSLICSFVVIISSILVGFDYKKQAD